MSNWNEEIDTPRKCSICKYMGYSCNCPYQFREAQCKTMEEKYFNCIDENGKRYRQLSSGSRIYKG